MQLKHISDVYNVNDIKQLQFPPEDGSDMNSKLHYVIQSKFQ